MNKILRDYQREMLGRLEKAWVDHRSVMVQMPTGTGKTLILAEVIRQEMGNEELGMMNGNSKGILIVAHRRELIEQIKETLRAFGISEEWVRVESIQKLYSHFGDSPRWEPQLVIVDEAHHAVAKTYRMLWEKWPEAKFLGLTATPCRLNGTGFTDLFDVLLQSWTIQEFIDKGWLSDFEYVSVTPDNMLVERIHGLKKRGVDGDYQTKEMATVMDTPESIAHLYNSYEQYVSGKKGIVYAISREHAQHIADYYQERGVSCAVIDAKTPATVRAEIVERYAHGGTAHRGQAHRGQALCNSLRYSQQGQSPSQQGQSPCAVDVLINVDIFSEGFDVPEVEFIQLARPTLSLSKYLQQVGRGMRALPHKECVVILDQVGMYQTFGLPTEDRDWEQMFRGNTAGKGLHGNERGYVIREDDKDKTLVNLEMVRIKRRGEKSTGVEIFVKGGRYGVLNDGKVTCQAEFEHIKRIKDSDFFAIATYPYAVFKGKTTIINLAGMDLRAALYGKVTQHGAIFEGESITGQRTFWDSVGMHYYSCRPEFETIGGVEMVKQGGKYLPRQRPEQVREAVGKEHIWYNRHIVWMKNVVVVKKTGKVYQVKAYGPECFFVASNDYSKGPLIRIDLDGRCEYTSPLDWDDSTMTDRPDWGQVSLMRA